MGAILDPINELEHKLPENHPLKSEIDKKQALKFHISNSKNSVLIFIGFVIIFNYFLGHKVGYFWMNVTLIIVYFAIILLGFMFNLADFVFSTYFEETPRRLSKLELYDYSKQIFNQIENTNEFIDFYNSSNKKLVILTLEYETRYKSKIKRTMNFVRFLVNVVPLSLIGIAYFLLRLSIQVIGFLLFIVFITAFVDDIIDYELIQWKYQMKLKSSLFDCIFRKSKVMDELQLELEKELIDNASIKENNLRETTEN